MARKTVKNRYGIQVGDHFVTDSYSESGSSCFYRVIRLRGETQVVVREVKSKIVAFDKRYLGLVPVPEFPDANGGGEYVRRVDSSGISDDKDIHIYIYKTLGGRAKLFKGIFHLSYNTVFSYMLMQYQPELAEQLDLRNGSGIFAVDDCFRSIGDACPALICYPDGREETVILSELLHYKEYRNLISDLNTPEAQKKIHEQLDKWQSEQKGE